MRLIRFLAFCTVLVPLLLVAAPLPEDQQGPVDVRRTTLLVRDIERSLPLYRDALGLAVVYDQSLGGGIDAEGETRPATARLVLLRGNDDFIGAIGLYQRLGEPDRPPAQNRRPEAGDIIMVINAKDLDTRFERIRNTAGVTVHTEPELRRYPTPDGAGVIEVMFSAIYDADGFFLEVNQILGTPAGQ